MRFCMAALVRVGAARAGFRSQDRAQQFLSRRRLRSATVFLEFYDRFGARQPLLQPEVLPPRKRKFRRQRVWFGCQERTGTENRGGPPAVLLISAGCCKSLLSLIWGITTGCLSYAPKGIRDHRGAGGSSA